MYTKYPKVRLKTIFTNSVLPQSSTIHMLFTSSPNSAQPTGWWGQRHWSPPTPELQSLGGTEIQLLKCIHTEVHVDCRWKMIHFNILLSRAVPMVLTNISSILFTYPKKVEFFSCSVINNEDWKRWYQKNKRRKDEIWRIWNILEFYTCSRDHSSTRHTLLLNWHSH